MESFYSHLDVFIDFPILDSDLEIIKFDEVQVGDFLKVTFRDRCDFGHVKLKGLGVHVFGVRWYAAYDSRLKDRYTYLERNNHVRVELVEPNIAYRALLYYTHKEKSNEIRGELDPRNRIGIPKMEDQIADKPKNISKQLNFGF